jgi:hypothetical protein
MGGGQAGDDRAQQLALARPGGPDDQAVGADPGFGGLLEVEDHRAPVRGRPDRDPEELAPIARSRDGAGRGGPGAGAAEQVEQAHRTGGGRRRAAVQPERGHPPGQGLAEREIGRVGVDAGDEPPARSGLLEGGRAPAVQAEAHGQLRRLAGDGPGEPDDRCPGRAGILEQRAKGRAAGGPAERRSVRALRRIGVERLGHVEDRDHVRPGRARRPVA